jgi:serine/threonine-protein kinase RIO1
MCFIDVLYVVQHKNSEDLNLLIYNVENMSGYFCCDHFGYANMDDNVVSSLFPLIPLFQTIETFLCEIQSLLIPACCSVGTRTLFLRVNWVEC